MEKYVELKEFEKQIDVILKSITISEKFKDWAIKYLHEVRKEEAEAQEDAFVAKQKRLTSITKQLDNLLLKYTSPENTDGQLIADEDYQGLKSRLVKERAAIESELQAQGKSIEEWVELSERTFNFARYARVWFARGDLETKRAIFSCLGSDFLLQDRKVALTLQKPFQIIFDGLPKAKEELERLELLDIGSIKGKKEVFASKFPVLSG